MLLASCYESGALRRETSGDEAHDETCWCTIQRADIRMLSMGSPNVLREVCTWLGVKPALIRPVYNSTTQSIES